MCTLNSIPRKKKLYHSLGTILLALVPIGHSSFHSGINGLIVEASISLL